MSKTVTYNTTVSWKGEHWGHIVMGNGPEMPFSAPPDAKGHPGVLTPEDAFVAAINTCIMMMFIWASKRFRIDLIGYDCRAEGTKLIKLDKTEVFTEVVLRPHIRVQAGAENPDVVRARVSKALQSAHKYSLIANSVKSTIWIEPEVEIIEEPDMLKIKILGPGCDNCRKVEEAARTAAAEMGLEVIIEKVTERDEFARYNLLMTPGLVINEKLVSGGRIPSVSEVKTLISRAVDVTVPVGL